MSSNLNFQSMKIFIAVFVHSSVGAAATLLGMSQSGLSTALARLRQTLGVDADRKLPPCLLRPQE